MQRYATKVLLPKSAAVHCQRDAPVDTTLESYRISLVELTIHNRDPYLRSVPRSPRPSKSVYSKYNSPRIVGDICPDACHLLNLPLQYLNVGDN